MEQAQVLLYNLERGTDRSRKICRYLRHKGILIRRVEAAEYLQPLGALLGWSGYSKRTLLPMQGIFSEEMLVMSGFSEAQLEDFLQFFLQEKLAPIGLKAIVTPINCSWTSIQLYQELKEHSI